MHIKQVIISGFRSFRNQGEIEPFSPKHNVIVGRNGSGKSNFFNAIQFVLVAPKFANLRQEDRQLLLHEGAGSSVMSAYVEIVFDNSDDRFSVDSDEVILRRTIGHKKDEFFLNRKRIQKGEVISLLESAGFSKSNPYYIVQQGKVANLCVMRDKDRLNLLKEIAGTTVYEERREESLKILQDTTHKQERIAEVLTFIEERLGELEREKEELKEYDLLDKNKRALQYTLYDKELRKLTSQLEAVEATRGESLVEQQELFVALSKLQDDLQQGEDELSSAKDSLTRLLERRDRKAEEVQSLVKKKSELQVDLQELTAEGSAKSAALLEYRNQMNDVMAAIDTREKELEDLAPVYNSQKQLLSELEQDLAKTTVRLETLYGKQGRGQQFKSVKERNSFLQEQVQSIKAQIKTKEMLMHRLNEEVKREDASLRQERQKLNLAEKEISDQHDHAEELSVKAKSLIQARNTAQELRKNAWKELENIQEATQEAKNDLEKGQHGLNSSLPRHVSQGLACVERIALDRGMVASGAYKGPLIDNFSLSNEAFRLAVETAAGNALFHVIVDTDATAATLMKELERRKAGRLTFLPLNRLSTQPIKYPDTNDVRSLLEVALQFDADVAPAIMQVFGKKLLARDLEVAAKYSRECQLDAITKEGDVVSRKGGFEGGYHDDRASKILSVQKIRDAKNRLESFSRQSEGITKRCDEAEAEINKALRELQSVEAERDHIKRQYSQASSEISARRHALEISIENLEKRRLGGVPAVEKELQALGAQIVSYQEEMQSPLVQSMSNEERGEVQQLHQRSQELQREISNAEQSVAKVNTERELLRVDLRDNLRKRYSELEAQLTSILGTRHTEKKLTGSEKITKGSSKTRSRRKDSGTAGDFDQEALHEAETNCKVELEQISRSVREHELELEAIEAQVLEKQSELQTLELQVDSVRQREKKQQGEIVQAGKSQDKLLNKRSMLYESSQQKQRSIMELGSLPRQQVEECQGMNEKSILMKLKEVNDRLKEFGGVNRKALDQYISFNEQREELVNRQEELENDKSAIQQLMDNLDMQKEQTILNTFDSVSHHFADVFQELVPGGFGRMIMITPADDADNDEEKDETPGVASISSFLGVRIEVSFSTSPGSGSAQVFEMQQLSGGQKALVALALIFAIQRCDPAPFYLFDEIDQALDANYRAGVARLIHRQANDSEAPAQFITTTFRPELVGVADQCYGIALQNKVSNIYQLEKRDAETFVNNLMTEEEAVGDVSHVASYSTSSFLSTSASSSARGSSFESNTLGTEGRSSLYSDNEGSIQGHDGDGSPPSVAVELEEEAPPRRSRKSTKTGDQEKNSLGAAAELSRPAGRRKAEIPH